MWAACSYRSSRPRAVAELGRGGWKGWLSLRMAAGLRGSSKPAGGGGVSKTEILFLVGALFSSDTLLETASLPRPIFLTRGFFNSALFSG